MKYEVSDPALTSQVGSTKITQLHIMLDEMESERHVEYGVHATPTPYSIWCRGIDILFGIGGTVILSLLLLILVPLMLLDSPGPIFYFQERVGYRGKNFWIIKLRSMSQNAEQGGQAIWATKQDQRITRIGRFLRATHIDEVPQVINILRGEMSLIGPRPQRAVYARELEQANPEYRDRLLIKPGLTGLSQVSYGYGNSSNSELEKLRYDLLYIQQRSIKMDIRILLKTVVEVLGGHGV